MVASEKAIDSSRQMISRSPNSRKRTAAIHCSRGNSMLTTGSPAPPQFTPGASGLGDPYFPADGNGGYDVEHYLLEVRYDPATDTLNGVATITTNGTAGGSLSVTFCVTAITHASLTYNSAANVETCDSN